MPAYEFECPGCGGKRDEVLGVADRDSVYVECDCGIEMVRRITAPAVTFRGPGFYHTDSRREKK